MTKAIKMLELLSKPALLITAALIGWTMGHSISVLASPMQPIMAQQQAPSLQLKDVAGYIMAVAGAVTIVGGGWVAYAQLQFRKISGIGRGLDDERKSNEAAWREHMEKYNDDKLAMVKEYATKADLERIDQHMDKMRKEFIDGLDKIDRRIEGVYKRLERKED